MKITFPHLGNVYIAAKAFLEDMGHEVIPPPVCSRKTLEIGTKFSPEMMCMPFKIFIGNYIESIQKGADTIVITGSCGPCRFGFYGDMQKDLLRDLGYDVEVIVLESPKEGLKDFKNNIGKLIGSNSLWSIGKNIKPALNLIKIIDELTQLSNKVRAFALDKKEVNKIMDDYYEEAVRVCGTKEITKLTRATENKLKEVKVDQSHSPIKIGIIGEIYTIIEPFVNLEVERKLGDMGVLVEKSLTPTKWFDHHVYSYPFGSKEENLKFKLAKPYLKTMVGGHGRETIGSAIYYNNMGYDGTIQILPLNCMPEIVAKSILKTVSKDLNFPIMTLVVDEMTGEAGYMTRLEAFVDLINKRREEMLIG
ncbi:2-hydroxyacyl-CoA dehydratase [Wansuia hejianensis]|uniref:CoA protein activase n=1 Tax=Wansuia hejianensis TaxID=2763667 RepID=A0A926EVY3_9FIRM|nr:2-hydroxyacyl-CoA dehydratase [Wansuia hejianensis]MBC8590868.1 CoA protein activase [Wansuia hejianensis]